MKCIFVLICSSILLCVVGCGKKEPPTRQEAPPPQASPSPSSPATTEAVASSSEVKPASSSEAKPAAASEVKAMPIPQSIKETPHPKRIKVSRVTADWEAGASKWYLEQQQKAFKEHAAEYDEVRKKLDSEPVAALAASIAEANKAKGFVLFQRPFKNFILAKETPTEKETQFDKLKIQLAGNEWEPIQFGVWPLKDGGNFSCQVSELRLKGGDYRVGGNNVRVFYPSQVLFPKLKKATEAPDGDVAATGAAQRNKKVVVGWDERPAALMVLPGVSLQKERAQAVLIDVFMPEEAPAGEYEGEVSLLIDGKEAQKIPLVAQVYPFRLDFADDWSRGAFISKMRNKDELIQMSEHGMNMVSWWSGGYEVKLKDGKIETDFTIYKDYAKLLDETGFVGPHMIFLGASDPKIENIVFQLLGRPIIKDARNKKNAEAFEKADLSPPFGDHLCEVLRQFHQSMKEVGHPRLAACILDEPDHEPRPARRDFYLKVYDMVEKGVPELPTYGVFYHEGDEDRLSHHHTFWCSNRPAAKIATMCKKAGKELWTYGFGFAFSTEPAKRRFNYGYVPWIFGCTGSFFWGNYWTEGKSYDPWATKDTSTVSLETPEGPLATPALKTARENIDDARYVRMLERLIKVASTMSGDAKAEATKHQEFLDGLRKPLFDNLSVVGGNNKIGPVAGQTITALDGGKMTLSDDMDFYDLSEFLRRDIAQRIIALTATMK
jgi:hypothetical protein